MRRAERIDYPPGGWPGARALDRAAPRSTSARDVGASVGSVLVAPVPVEPPCSPR
jgi:hypothetical protein